MSVQLRKHCFSVAEYHQMAEVGLLSEDSRVELIEGEIIEMSPIGSTHGGAVKRSSAFLNRALGDRVIVSVQDPICLDDFSEPQPDIALLKPREDFYAKSHPTPEDVLVVIEVADPSLQYDRNVKLPLYARAGNPGGLVGCPCEGRHRGSLTAKEGEVSKGPEDQAGQVPHFLCNPRILLPG